MRLLFDENLPYSLARVMVGHDCVSVIRLDWRGTENGALLTRAEQAGFDILVTLDEDMKWEQSMAGRTISVLVLKPTAQGKAALRSMGKQALLALETIGKGQIVVVRSSQ